MKNTGLDISSLVIVIEDNIDPELIFDKEIYYIAKYREEGYVLTNLTNGGQGGYEISGEIAKKHSIIMKEKWKGIFGEQQRSMRSMDDSDWKKKMIESKTGVKWGHHSEKTKELMSNLRKGIKFSDEHKENLSIARKKRITTPETKRKMSLSSKGKINIKKYKMIDPEGVVYITEEGLTKFCEEHDLTGSNILKVIKGTRKSHKGWTAERID